AADGTKPQEPEREQRNEVEKPAREQGRNTQIEIGSRAWFENTINLIRQRFFTLKDFSGQGRAYFSEDYDFDPAAVEKNLNKFPDLQQWMPELADKFESEFRDGSAFHELAIEAVVKSFTEEKGTKLGVIMNG